MADHFESSQRKLARAKEHITDLEQRMRDFANLYPYDKFIEPHPDKPDHSVHKIKLIKDVPDSFADITADAVQNLRKSLDNAAYAIAVASGKFDPKFTAFPFAGSVGQMANSLGRAKDLPKEIQSLFCGFQPYLGGNDLLWALNEICNADKHKMLIPIGTGMLQASAGIRGTGYFSMPDPHFWNRAKNEVELVTLGPGAKFEYNFDFRFFIAFNEINVVDGQPVLRILHQLRSIVERILVAMEAEAGRLGIVR